MDKLYLRPAPPKPAEPETSSLEDAMVRALRRVRDETPESPLDNVKRRLSEAAAEIDPDAGWTHSTGGGEPAVSLRDLKRAGRALVREESPLGGGWMDTNPERIGHDD